VSAHPIHISVSEVEIRDAHVEWTIRIFKDDLLLALYGKSTSMDRLNDESRIRKDVLKYLSEHIQLSSSTSKAIWQLTDIQSDVEAVWMTLQTPFVFPEDHQVDIRNSVLLKEYNDQKNITHITRDGDTQSVVFDDGDEQKLISF
jgi:hypothetical protein